jgi:hypothetical protein
MVLAAPSTAQDRTIATIGTGQSVSGEITPNDSQRRSGKYEDLFVIEGRRGGRIDLRLSSTDFDPYLVLTGPAGFSLSNDDEGEDSRSSRLITEFPADGAYRIAVTTYRPGETGRYRLQAAAPTAGSPMARPEPAEPIAIGATINGRLVESDGRLASGEHVDRYRFSARRGQRIRAELSAGKFDTYLILRRPDGTQDDNDDSEVNGETVTDSRIDTVLSEDGDHVLIVTSYRPGERGRSAPGRRAGWPARPGPARRSLRLWRPHRQPPQHGRGCAAAVRKPSRRRPAPSGEHAPHQ